MNNTSVTPPCTVNLPYNKFVFERIISKMDLEHVLNVSIEVWAEEGPNCIELLRSGLSSEEFDTWAEKASRMIFRGLPAHLRSLGIRVA